MSDPETAICCMMVSNPTGAMQPDGWKKRVNDHMRAQTARIAALEAALKDADDALTEAEAILGGEYGDHHATLCETMLKLRGRIAALGACQ